MDIVKQVLEKQQKDLEKFKPINVEKHLEVRIDLGHLMSSDPNDLDEKELKENKSDYLLSLTRDNLQLLVNGVWELPTERVEECIVAKLPAPGFILPRIRKVPGPRPLTKWEQFAKEKGIKKKKRDAKVFDTVLDKWVPTYGFKHAQAQREKEWVLEVPKNADPMEDQFQKKIDLRSEKVAKNEIQRMKNIVRAKKIAVPRTGYLGPEAASSKELLTAATVAKASTASVGKFQEKIAKEKTARGIGVKELIPGSKRKASHVGLVTEKEANLDLIKSVLSKRPKIDEDKAVTLQKRADREDREADEQEGGGKGGRKGGKKGGGGKRKRDHIRSSARKPKAGRGERDPKKKVGGRKRR